MDAGLALGYRRNKRGGAWLARRWLADTKRYREAPIGPADDTQDADGAVVLNFSQAQAKAREWWREEERAAAGHEPIARGPYTVADAITDYLAGRERRGSKGVYSDRRYAEARILPALGSVPLARLTSAQIRKWLEDTAAQHKLVKTRRGATERRVKTVDFSDADATRARRASANRVLTVLKAALNHAFHENLVATDESWRRVKPFREVESAIVRYLTAYEAERLVRECSPDFGALVQAALLTGARYGELAAMRVSDFNAEAGRLAVRKSKSGRARYIVLSDEGVRLLCKLTVDKPGEALIFSREGKPWKASEQQRPLADASKRAKIKPAVTFHILRHSHASALAMAGTPLEVIAEQLGHADTRVTRRHYAHLSPSYIANAIRQGLGTFGAVTDGAP